MAFNFMSGQQQSYDPFSPYQQSFYNDPRRKGAQGSFNPFALSNFAATSAKGGMQPPQDTKVPLPPYNPTAPQTPTMPSTPTSPPTAPSASSRPVGNTTTPGGGGGGGGGAGAFNYASYPTLQALYAAHPGGLPVGFDMNAWAQATGNQSVMNQSTSGDQMRFTWNTDGPGYINPQTGETYDRPGETYPNTPAPPSPPIFQPGGGGGNLQGVLSRYGGGNFRFGR